MNYWFKMSKIDLTIIINTVIVLGVRTMHKFKVVFLLYLVVSTQALNIPEAPSSFQVSIYLNYKFYTQAIIKFKSFFKSIRQLYFIF